VFGSVRVRSVSHGAACASMAMNDNAVRLIMGVVYTPAGCFNNRTIPHSPR
jgi:hypothetical protein